MSATEYKPGDMLYEATTVVDGKHRAHQIVREWTVLSVVRDPDYTDDAGPLQVVTLRAFSKDQAIYKAEIAPVLDIRVAHGCWRRTRAEADALLAEWASR